MSEAERSMPWVLILWKKPSSPCLGDNTSAPPPPHPAQSQACEGYTQSNGDFERQAAQLVCVQQNNKATDLT